MSLNGWNVSSCIRNYRHDVTITTHAIKRHFLLWMTTVRQSTKHRCSCVFTLKYTFICVYWWTRQKIHNTLILVDWYLRLIGDKTIPDSAEPRLESFYPPFVAGIDLPHQFQTRWSFVWNRFIPHSLQVSIYHINSRLGGASSGIVLSPIRCRYRSTTSIPDSVEPRLESFYPPFVAGIDLPHQFQTRWSLVWNRFIPHSLQVSIYHISVLWIVIVSYTRVSQTSAGCLRSIYPSLGMRQLFGYVTMGQWRHNYPTQLNDVIIH